jgi:DNA-binding transcriptional LysR family regulator
MNPDLADLDAFAAVARARSFRGAATVRGVSASALSEAVRRLEARLGLRLLNRTTRSVTPTEAGTQLLERLAPALSEVSAAIDAVNKFRNSPTGTLRLNVPGIVAQLFLPPIVERFLRAHPALWSKSRPTTASSMCWRRVSTPACATTNDWSRT